MEGKTIGATKTIVGIVLVAILAMIIFYPLEIFIPEGFWPFIPEILLRYPIMYLLSQLQPAILFFGTFVIGVLLLRGVLHLIIWELIWLLKNMY